MTDLKENEKNQERRVRRKFWIWDRVDEFTLETEKSQQTRT